MTKETLEFINKRLVENGINYEFGMWNSEIVYPYFVGEYTDTGIDPECGFHESAFVLTGFSRESWLELQNAKEKIERLFANSTHILKSGNGLAIYYNGTMIVPTDDMDLKRIQINLTIKEWKVN